MKLYKEYKENMKALYGSMVDILFICSIFDFPRLTPVTIYSHLCNRSDFQIYI